jgi:hypothetical protein
MLFSTAIASAQTDLSTRVALYYTGAKIDKIDLKNDPYAAKGQPMTLTVKQATSCDQQACEFNVGYIGFRTGNTNGVLSTYGLLQVDGGGMVGNTLFFADNEGIKQAILPLKLKVGFNKVTLTVDPYKKTAESNENNNSLFVYIRVSRR